MTLKDTPSIVTASGVAGLEFTDEVKTANALVPVLKAQGVNAIVVLIHQGGNVPAVHALRLHLPGRRHALGRLADHPDRRGSRPGHRHDHLGPHAPALRLQPPRPQRSAAPHHLGLVVRPPLHRDRRDLRPSHAATSCVRRSVDSAQHARDPRPWPRTRRRRRSSPTYNDARQGRSRARSSARSPTDVSRRRQRRWRVAARRPHRRRPARRPVGRRPAASTPVIAFMNPGGIRADLTSPTAADEAPGDVTYEEAFTVQPFNNYLVSMDLTGAADHTTCSTQQCRRGANAERAPKILQVSRGLHLQLHDDRRRRSSAPSKLERRRRSTRPRPTGS